MKQKLLVSESVMHDAKARPIQMINESLLGIDSGNREMKIRVTVMQQRYFRKQIKKEN